MRKDWLLFAGLFGALVAPSQGCRTPTLPTDDPKPTSPEVRVNGSRVHFLSASDAARFLGESDAFTHSLSALDRSFRMRRTATTSDDSFRAFAKNQALAFSETERQALIKAILAVDKALLGRRLRLPPEVLVIQTTGKEELGDAYTRRNAIVLARKDTANRGDRVGLIAHELFHIASRADPVFQRECYALLGFQRVDAVSIPPSIEPTRITNPDGFGLEMALRITTPDAGSHLGVPVLTTDASLEALIAMPGDAWFKTLHVMLIHAGTDSDVRVWDAKDTDWFSRMRVNTDYAIHPDEVLADNFALWVRRELGQSVQAEKPEFLDALGKILRSPPP